MASPSHLVFCQCSARQLLSSSTYPSRRIRIRYALYSTQSTPQSFDQLGLNKALVGALKTAFPHIKKPTWSQAQFIPAVLKGTDVFLKNDTGTGKTFGLVLALLSKARRYHWEKPPNANQPIQKVMPSSLIITPHRELALQCLHWIRCIHQVNPGREPLSSVVQALVRGADNPLEQQLENLRRHTPHIAIATPQALLEILKEDPLALPVRGLSTVVVDEIDELVTYIPPNTDKYTQMSLLRRERRHPNVTRQILNYIYGVQPVTLIPNNKTGTVTRPHGFSRPQFVATSATLNAHFRRWLVVESGWVTERDDKVVIVSGSSNADYKTILEGNPPSRVHHSAIIVSKDGGIRNVAGAQPLEDPTSEAEAEGMDVEKIPLGEEESSNVTIPEEIPETPSPFNHYALEAIATAFALEVPRVALLVLPPNAPVKRAVYELRKLGVNAQALDVAEQERGQAYLLQGNQQTEENPTLLVCTLASVRGLDLPDLTHVFRLGLYDDRSTSTYLHVAGRVGRFGKEGKVITVIEPRTKIKDGKKTHNKDEPSLIGRLFSQLGITPVKLEYFEG
ncbi:P-loop containing nucleoside triphosphate hydrolase protein [Panus rudis PR-1116 ss-1]|nr:P-loop containing nucleoside triphosphate hydrolase protein [Panus rudis PR-1116 ss-1]